MLALPVSVFHLIDFLKVVREAGREGVVTLVLVVVLNSLVALSADSLLPAEMLSLEG